MMTDREKRGRRIVSIAMILVALLWGVEVVRQALRADDGGPPLGALCAALPAFGLIIAAGILWASTK